MATRSHQDRLAAEMAHEATRLWLRVSEKKSPMLSVSGTDVERLEEIMRGYLTIVYHRAYTRGYRRGKGR